MTRKFTHPNDAPEGHEWRTADGSEVKILLIDDRDGAMIGAYRVGYKHSWVPMKWYAGGSCQSKYKALNDKPETAERYINIYQCPRSGNLMSSILYEFKGDALKAGKRQGENYFACVKISAEKGSGT